MRSFTPIFVLVALVAAQSPPQIAKNACKGKYEGDKCTYQVDSQPVAHGTCQVQPVPGGELCCFSTSPNFCYK
ncbi:hypothetical protein PQX77_009340 [Marasmius sp. AFHP31]|nr:hypothetical protein PQX77_009340 [Marasmius sp. AFHP31]